MTEPIKLPPEFRSGNSIPVERATITRERMVEILTEAIEADRAALQSQDREDAPWGDLKVAFGCDDDEALWKAVESGKIHFPKGWKLIETDGSCARVVAIFRVDRIPTVADGESVREAIDAAMEKQP